MKYILIADGNPLNQSVLQKIVTELNKSENVVSVCSTGLEVVHLMATGNKYDLIIAEGNIFEKEIDFTVWMSKDEYYRSIPVIFLIGREANIIEYSGISQRIKFHTTLLKGYKQQSFLNLVNLFLNARTVA